MKKTTVAVLAIALLSSACATQEASQLPATSQAVDGRANLIVFGDSVSYCAVCFPSLIAAGLPNTKLDNRAVPGTQLNSEDQLGRILASSPQPGDRVVFLTGFNDLRVHGNDAAHLAEYKVALNKALTHLAASGQPIYVGTVEKPLCVDAASIARHPAGCEPGAEAAYAQAIKDEVAAVGASNLHVVDVNAEWTPSYDNLSDMVHTNAYGAGQLATIFLRYIK